ncbi:pyridoxal phosphate-dependent aminotransferase [Ectothiorhodospiraceae bacterium WFHF3C12]|nr:pyridoxal phosphate-dependent aminotransferase [Ectothiorhodospiraceae bacterium WFHF3C12]
MQQTQSAPLATRLAHIEPFHVMALLTRARALEAAGRSVVHMEIGEPDFPTAEPVVAAGIEALRSGHTQYTPAAGLPELREAIAGHYRTRYGVAVPADRIIVTPGASGALLLGIALLVDPGAEALLPDPGYPCNRHFVAALNGVPRLLPVGPDSGYQITPQRLAAEWTPETALAMVGSPSNPTGTLAREGDVRALAAGAGARGGALLVDEIYHGLEYGTRAMTAAGMGDNVFVVNSFSKYFGMTGWRLGWLVVPPGYESDAEKLAQNLFIAAATISQHAALACFTDAAEAIFEERRRAFEARLEFLANALVELGFEIPGRPQGAFYLYSDCSRLTGDSFAFAERLLEEAGVAATPGLDFGDHRAAEHIRFAYTNSLENLREGVERMRSFLASR